MFKINAEFDAGLLLYLLSHFECDGHTVHMLTQWHLLFQLTSTVKSSLFTHAHSSPLSLSGRLHPCCTSRSCYISNGWTFSRETSNICVPIDIRVRIMLYLYDTIKLPKSAFLILLLNEDTLRKIVLNWSCLSFEASKTQKA